MLAIEAPRVIDPYQARSSQAGFLWAGRQALIAQACSSGLCAQRHVEGVCSQVGVRGACLSLEAGLLREVGHAARACRMGFAKVHQFVHIMRCVEHRVGAGFPAVLRDVWLNGVCGHNRFLPGLERVAIFQHAKAGAPARKKSTMARLQRPPLAPGQRLAAASVSAWPTNFSEAISCMRGIGDTALHEPKRASGDERTRLRITRGLAGTGKYRFRGPRFLARQCRCQW